MFYPLQSHSKEGSMGRKRLHGQLIGIRLLPDSYIPQCVNTEQLNEGKIVGTVLIPIEGTSCAQLRKAINNTLEVPKEFCFLNSAGWPFDSSLDDKIFIVDCLTSNVVTIQQKFAKLSRIGIKHLNGPVLGFIYLNFHFEISAVRNIIMSELAEQFENETFLFVDSNLWPVQRKQENELSVWDLVVNNCITIIKKLMKRSFDNEPIQNYKKFKSSRNSDVMNEDRKLNSHSILISYVHREATLYAKELKKALKKIGFQNIFLDIDDIPAGVDWQDVISSAVNECTIFIPLVTHRYGETRWTNREAKLADDREKLIIPISFLDKWPPDQLAIQFLSLQYIPWKIYEDAYGGSFSGQSDAAWSQDNVLRVANKIKTLCSSNEVSTPDSASLLDEIPNPALFKLNLNGKSKKKVNLTENILIVISAHLKQQKFVEEKISKMLHNEGYQTWNSMNLCDCDEISCSPIEDSQPNTPTMEHSSSISNIGRVKSLKSIFKTKVKEAKLVLLVFSEDYIKSSICRQQAFYCEQRKKSIVIKHKAVHIDSPILNLYPEEEMITTDNLECLKYKIHEKLNHNHETSYWNCVSLKVTKLKKAINTNRAVYIIGADNKMTKNVEEFCRNLGNELAKVENLSIAIGGSTGVADIIGRNFCEEQQIMNKGQIPKLFHIIPEDSSTVNSTDDSIKFTYGKTLQYGASVSNRNDIVANAFKVCLLISGGEKAACLAEKFLFNECIVIPVFHSSLSDILKNSIDKVPDDVSEIDWQRINKPVSPEERAKIVKRIICDILNI